MVWRRMFTFMNSHWALFIPPNYKFSHCKQVLLLYFFCRYVYCLSLRWNNAIRYLEKNKSMRFGGMRLSGHFK